MSRDSSPYGYVDKPGATHVPGPLVPFLLAVLFGSLVGAAIAAYASRRMSVPVAQHEALCETAYATAPDSAAFLLSHRACGDILAAKKEVTDE